MANCEPQQHGSCAIPYEIGLPSRLTRTKDGPTKLDSREIGIALQMQSRAVQMIFQMQMIQGNCPVTISPCNPAMPYPAGCSHVERSRVSLLGEEIVLRQKASTTVWLAASWPHLKGIKGVSNGYERLQKGDTIKGILSIPNRKVAMNGYDDK